MSAARRYLRNQGGTTIHRWDCKRAGMGAIPWHYAEGMTADDLVAVVAIHPWLKPCKVCKPLKVTA